MLPHGPVAALSFGPRCPHATPGADGSFGVETGSSSLPCGQGLTLDFLRHGPVWPESRQPSGRGCVLYVRVGPLEFLREAVVPRKKTILEDAESLAIYAS